MIPLMIAIVAVTQMRRFVSDGQARRGVQIRVSLSEWRILQPHEWRMLLHTRLDGTQDFVQLNMMRIPRCVNFICKYLLNRVRFVRIDARRVSGAITALKRAIVITEPAAITLWASVNANRASMRTKYVNANLTNYINVALN